MRAGDALRGLHSQQALEPRTQDRAERVRIRDLAAVDHRLKLRNLDRAHRRNTLAQLRRADRIDAAKEQRDRAADERGRAVHESERHQALTMAADLFLKLGL